MRSRARFSPRPGYHPVSQVRRSQLQAVEVAEAGFDSNSGLGVRLQSSFCLRGHTLHLKEERERSLVSLITAIVSAPFWGSLRNTPQEQAEGSPAQSRGFSPSRPQLSVR